VAAAIGNMNSPRADSVRQITSSASDRLYPSDAFALRRELTALCTNKKKEGITKERMSQCYYKSAVISSFLTMERQL